MVGSSNAKLHDAVKAYMGKDPHGAWVHREAHKDPELYKKYNWPQVETFLQVTGAHIVDVETSSVSVSSVCLINNSSDTTGSFTAGLNTTVANSASSTWQNTVSTSCTEDISATIGVPGDSITEKTSMTITAAAGVGGSDSMTTSISDTGSVTQSLAPKQAKLAVLTSTLSTLKVEVAYQVSLSGCSALNYNPTYKGHHFYCPDINNVLRAGGIATYHDMTQTINVDSYAKGSVVINDATITNGGSDCEQKV